MAFSAFSVLLIFSDDEIICNGHSNEDIVGSCIFCDASRNFAICCV